jgi:hypothetical protein
VICPAQAPHRRAAGELRQGWGAARLSRGGVEAQAHLAGHGRQHLNLLPQIGVVVEQAFLPFEHRLKALLELPLKDVWKLLQQGFQFGNLKSRFGQLAFSTGQSQLQLVFAQLEAGILSLFGFRLHVRLIGAGVVHRCQPSHKKPTKP